MALRMKSIVAGLLFCGALSTQAQVGDISLSGGLFINSYTFSDASSLFSVGGSAWAKFDLGERLQIGGHVGIYTGASTSGLFGLEVVDSKTFDVPLLATLTYKVGNPDSWHAFIGLQAGIYYEVQKLSALGVEIYNEATVLPTVGILGGVQVPITDALFIQVRTGVDFLIYSDVTLTDPDTLEEAIQEGEVGIVFPVSMGLGLRF